jgi:hypothetical protein
MLHLKVGVEDDKGGTLKFKARRSFGRFLNMRARFPPKRGPLKVV